MRRYANGLGCGASGDQDPAARNQHRCVVVAAAVHRRGQGPGIESRVVDFRRPTGVAPRDQHLARRQQSRCVSIAPGAERRGGFETTVRRVENVDACSGRSVGRVGEPLRPAALDLEQLETSSSPLVTHITYRIVRSS